MHAADVPDAFHMLSDFLGADEHYLASSQAYGDLGLKGLNDALDLFLERPELGFVWMAFDEKGVAGICVVCYAISTSMGSVVAKLDDVSVKPDRRGKGIGTELLLQLKEQLRKEAVTRIDVAVHLENPQAKSFYEKTRLRRAERRAPLLFDITLCSACGLNRALESTTPQASGLAYYLAGLRSPRNTSQTPPSHLTPAANQNSHSARDSRAQEATAPRNSTGHFKTFSILVIAPIVPPSRTKTASRLNANLIARFKACGNSPSSTVRNAGAACSN